MKKQQLQTPDTMQEIHVLSTDELTKIMGGFDLAGNDSDTPTSGNPRCDVEPPTSGTARCGTITT